MLSMAAEALLEVDGLEAGYGEIQVLWGVSLRVPKGQLTAIVGANGVGKTTTLRAITGLVRPLGGSVRLAGMDVTGQSTHARAAHGLVMVPEGRQLFPDMTIAENLEMGAFAGRAHRHRSANLDKVFTLFPRLKERRKQRANTLSGGEQQMLAVGRGLMGEPRVLLIDEVSLGLSPLMTQQLFSTLKSLKGDGTTMLLVEQNVHLSLALCDYAYVLAEGRVFIEGPARQVAENPDIKAAYLGL
jgi:branched-chain amino acid transport system ATP-binding protein